MKQDHQRDRNREYRLSAQQILQGEPHDPC
jgi:hypothetical protein